MRGGFLYFFPEQPDVRSKVLKLLSILKPPYSPEKLRVMERHVWVFHEVKQQAELNGREGNFDSRFAQDSMFNIQPEIAGAQNRLLHLFLIAGSATRDGTQARQQLAHAEG